MASPQPAPFLLTRAYSEDIPAIAAIQYECFQPTIRERFMGCYSVEDVPRYAAFLQDRLENDTTRVWIKVVERETGRLVAASNWRIQPGTWESRAVTALPWVKQEHQGSMTALLSRAEQMRKEAGAKGLVHLNICFTDESFRGRGVGGMMVKWGCDVADALGVPAWVEASPEGNLLYKKFGFQEFENFDMGGKAMRREAQLVAIEGGKVKP